MRRQRAADFQHTHTVSFKLTDSGLHRWFLRTATQFRALCPSPGKSGVHPLTDYAPLEISKHTQHLKHRLAGRRRGIESLLMQEQADSMCANTGSYHA